VIIYKKLALLTIMTKPKQTFGVCLPAEILAKIDTDRGDIPRSRFLLRILEKAYPSETKKQEIATVN
jgi:hypothetical protein